MSQQIGAGGSGGQAITFWQKQGMFIDYIWGTNLSGKADIVGGNAGKGVLTPYKDTAKDVGNQIPYVNQFVPDNLPGQDEDLPKILLYLFGFLAVILLIKR